MAIEKGKDNMFNKKIYMKEYQKQYYQKNKDKLKTGHNKWLEDNPEYSKQYYQDNINHKSEYNKQWRKNNPEKHKEYYYNNFDKIKIYSKQWQKDNQEYLEKYSKQWRINNLEHCKEYRKQYRGINPEKVRELGKQWNKNNPEYKSNYYKKNQKEISEKHKQWNENNPEYRKQWREDNIKRCRERDNQYCKNRLKIDLKYNLNHKISNAMRRSLNKNKAGRHWEDLVGYSLNDLIKYLKSTMPGGYTWQDYIGNKLQIDHIIPISVFNYTQPEHIDFKQCWSLENLQLLPTKENIVKSNKLIKPFQPAFKLSIVEVL